MTKNSSRQCATRRGVGGFGCNFRQERKLSHGSSGCSTYSKSHTFPELKFSFSFGQPLWTTNQTHEQPTCPNKHYPNLSSGMFDCSFCVCLCNLRRELKLRNVWLVDTFEKPNISWAELKTRSTNTMRKPMGHQTSTNKFQIEAPVYCCCFL